MLATLSFAFTVLSELLVHNTDRATIRCHQSQDYETRGLNFAGELAALLFLVFYQTFMEYTVDMSEIGNLRGKV